MLDYGCGWEIFWKQFARGIGFLIFDEDTGKLNVFGAM